MSEYRNDSKYSDTILVLGTFDRFPAISTRKTTSIALFVFLHSDLILKRGYFYRKEFTPRWSKVCPVKVDYYSGRK